MFQNPLVPRSKREEIISHIVLVHQSVGVHSKRFQQQLRRHNYVTPKNYLDYITTYLKLLDEKDNFIQSLVGSYRLSLLEGLYLILDFTAKV